MGKGPPPPIQDSEWQLVNDFHRLFYALDTRTWGDTRWLGAQAQKCPLDLWVVQEILVETRPEVVIEVGVCGGGATLFAASILDHVGGGEVIGVDIDLSQVDSDSATRQHPRITLVEGSSIDPEVIAHVRDLVGGRRAMVELDSDHSADHVRAELDLYSPLVAPGCYLVVEDTNLNGRPVLPEHGPGPTEALEAWLETNPPFTRDRSREKYLMTFNPGGYLRRTA